MASRLVPCSSCSRHIKLGPTPCPFCGADAPTNVAPRPVVQGRPLSRAAVLFASATAVAACSSSSAPEPKDAGHDSGQAEPLYGAVALDGSFPGEDAGQDSGQAEPLYGAVALDGSFPGEDATGHPQPAYGVIASDAGSPGEDGGAVAAYGVFVDGGT